LVPLDGDFTSPCLKYLNVFLLSAIFYYMAERDMVDIFYESFVTFI